MGRIAGIDFGTVRIGLAISDERKIIARSLPTLRAAHTLELIAQQISHALQSYLPIDKIVIGLPLLLNGKEGEMALKAKQLGTTLEKILPIPIHYWDERLTSAQVDRFLKEGELSRKKRATLSDQMAAVAILQNYLDSL